MLKTIAQFEHKVGDRVYTFLCDNDAPLGEAHDALTKFKTHVITLITAADQKKQEQAEQAPKTE